MKVKFPKHLIDFFRECGKRGGRPAEFNSRRQVKLREHNAEIMRQAIGKASTRDVYKRCTAHLTLEMPNDFHKQQKGK